MTSSLPVRDRVPGNPVHGVFVDAPKGHEVPWIYQLFLVEDSGRVAVDYPRPLRQFPAVFRLSAELLGVEPGTRFEIDVLAYNPARKPRLWSVIGFDGRVRLVAQVQSLGPIGSNVARNLRELRGTMSYKSLSEKLAALGRPIPELGLSRIENGARRVDGDDLVALAAALDVSPIRLLMPFTAKGDVELASKLVVEALVAWDWMRATRPLDLPEEQEEAVIRAVKFQAQSLPMGARAPITAETLGVISGVDAQDLPVGAEIQSVFDSGPHGRRRRTADGWVCDAAPVGGHPSWHQVAASGSLGWRRIS